MVIKPVNELQILNVGLESRYKEVVGVWVSTGSVERVREKLSELKCREVSNVYAKRFLKCRGVVEEIQRQLLAVGYDKVELERDLVKDIKGIRKLEDGQRESIKVLAKVRGYMSDGVNVNAEMVGGISIVQSNGRK